MSQVHSVTHVPVHSPFSEVWLLYCVWNACPIPGAGVAGSNGPAVVVGGSRETAGDIRRAELLAPEKVCECSPDSIPQSDR